MSNPVVGKLIMRSQVEEFGGNGFTKRTFVIETADNPQYPQEIEFELHKDKTGLIDAFQKDQIIQVSYNLRGRRWLKEGEPASKTRWFNTLVAWKIEAYQNGQSVPPQVTQHQPVPVAQPVPTVEELEDDSDDLPF